MDPFEGHQISNKDRQLVKVRIYGAILSKVFLTNKNQR